MSDDNNLSSDQKFDLIQMSLVLVFVSFIIYKCG